MNLGTVNKLKILRESDISYILTDGENEIFLHKKEAKEPYQNGDEIEVFLYADNQGRVTASTKTPLLIIGKLALLKVVSLNYDYGAFLYNGMIKDLLLSKDDLPRQKQKWPQIDDHIFVGMTEKKGKLFAYIPTRQELHEYFLENESLDENATVTAFCELVTDAGIICYTEEGHEIFIHNNNFRDKKRIGEAVEVTILKEVEKNKYTGTLIEHKEIMLEKDALRIYHYMENHKGQMPYTDKTDKETIQTVFHMSKSAFKRALGTLYKAKQITLEENKTKIINK